MLQCDFLKGGYYMSKLKTSAALQKEIEKLIAEKEKAEERERKELYFQNVLIRSGIGEKMIGVDNTILKIVANNICNNFSDLVAAAVSSQKFDKQNTQVITPVSSATVVESVKDSKQYVSNTEDDEN